MGAAFMRPQEVWVKNLAITRKNLILPTAMFLSISVGTFFVSFLKKKLNLSSSIAKSLAILGILIVLLTGGVYYSNKFLPVSPKKFFFPDHPIFSWLEENGGIDRFYGQGVAHIDYSFPIHYGVYGAEGYDTVRYQRYAELLASSYNGQVPQTYPRSEAVFPSEENGYRRRLFDLLGIKYLLNKVDDPKNNADWHYEVFDKDQTEGIWQNGKFQIYQRKTVIPRIFLTTNYVVAANDTEIIDKIYDQNFNLKTLVLEKEPNIKIENDNQEITIPDLLNYQPQEISIKTAKDNNSLLFISDVYDKDWAVKVDDKDAELLRADYALRSVAVPQGQHEVTFKYRQKSFEKGVLITGASIITLLLVCLFWIKTKKF